MNFAPLRNLWWESPVCKLVKRRIRLEKWRSMTKEEVISYIEESIAEGKTLRVIASDLGYRSHSAISNLLHRYGVAEEPHEAMNHTVNFSLKNDKVQQINDGIKNGEPLREVAILNGFYDENDMADWLLDEGWTWSAKVGQYMKQENHFEEPHTEKPSLLQDASQHPSTNWMDRIQQLEKELTDIKDVLHMDRSNELLTIPNYVVPGMKKSQTIYVADRLLQLVDSYKQEKNVEKHQIFAAALIEFFQKYGYRDKVRRFLV